MTNKFYNRGQALITFIFFVMIILSVSTAAVLLAAISLSSTTKYTEATLAYSVAEAGVENALIRLLRDPDYTGESDFAVDDGTATIVVTHGSPITVVSTGRLGNFVRKIQVQITNTNGYYTFSSWEEIP